MRRIEIMRKEKFIVFLILLFLFFSQVLYSEPSISYYKFGPFFEGYSTKYRTYEVISPLYIHRKNIYIESYFFLPLFLQVRKTTSYIQYDALFSIFSYSKNYQKKEFDVGIFPIFLYGRGESSKENYLFIYPFGGTLKGKIGLDTIKIFFFPFVFLPFYYGVSILTILPAFIPLYMEYSYKDYKAYNIFWPMFLYGRSRRRKELRFLPFFAYSYKKDVYIKYNFLLLFNYQKIYTKKGDIEYTFFLFPFFGYKRNKKASYFAYTIFYPFISWGENSETECYEYNFPWPIIQIASCKSPIIKKYIFFPFYGFYRYRNRIIEFFGPLYFSIYKQRKTEEISMRFFFPFYTSFVKKTRIEKSNKYKITRKYLKLFPFITIDKKENSYTIQILSLWPIYDPDYMEPLLSPFFSLFYYHHKSNGFKIISFLFRCISIYGDNESKIFELFPVFKIGKSEKRFFLFFLLEAFGYYEDEKETYIKLLWFPIYLKKKFYEENTKNISYDLTKNRYNAIKFEFRI
jgi:hypothetical protein